MLLLLAGAATVGVIGPSKSFHAVLKILGIDRVKLTVPEGFNRFDIAKRVARLELCTEAEFLSATEDAKTLQKEGVFAKNAEGYLFPDTYLIPNPSPCTEIVARMLRSYRAHTDSLWTLNAPALSELQRTLSFSRSDVVTLASIVEKEAAVDDERPMIAGVFLNRLSDPLFKPKRLYSDPTATYGCLVLGSSLASCEGFDGHHVRPQMLRDAENPYNTYRVIGLPPGPISNPGVSSIRAVLQPAHHRYFYFVAKGGRRHAFSETLDAHNDAVDRARDNVTTDAGK